MDSVLRGRARLVALVGILGLVAALALVVPWLLPPASARSAGSVALVAFPLFAAAACWWCAVMMSTRPMRTQWLVLGLAPFLFACGQALEESGANAALGGFTLAKALYVLAIVTFGAGTWRALRAFVGFLDTRTAVRKSVLIAVAVSVVGGVVLALLFGHLPGTMEDKIMLVVYPAGLLWVMAAPALALALTVSQMGSGSLARPWWAVWGGVSLIAVGSLGLVVTDSMGIPINNGGPAEFSWWMGLCLVALGAALQIDVQRPAMTLVDE